MATRKGIVPVVYMESRVRQMAQEGEQMDKKLIKLLVFIAFELAIVAMFLSLNYIH